MTCWGGRSSFGLTLFPSLLLSVTPSLAPKRKRGGTFAIAIAVQCVLLAATLLVMVSEDVPEVIPDFQGERLVSVSQDSRKTQKKIRELKKRMSRPRSFQRLAVENSFASDLPPAPALPTDAFNMDGADAAFLESSQGLLADSGLLESIGGALGRESAAEFFGVKASGRRIVIVVNTSASVVRKASRRGVSIGGIQAEVAKLIEELDSGTQFGIVQFSQGARGFAEHLAPALKRNKVLAADWARSELKGNPKIVDEEFLGHEAAFHLAMELQPDLIFLVTDGSLNRRTRTTSGYSYPKISFQQLINSVDREMRENAASPRIHIVGFELGNAEREGLRRFARRFGGTVREF